MPVARVLRPRGGGGREIIFMAGAGAVVLVLMIIFAVFMLVGPAMVKVVGEVHDATVKPKPLQPPPPLTAEQQAALEEFGRDLARWINFRDISKLASLVDDAALTTRVLEKLPPALARPGTRGNLADILHENSGSWLWEVMGGNAEYVRSVVREGFPAVLLRTERRPENYVEIMVRPEGGGFRVVDAFSRLLARSSSEEHCNVLASRVDSPPASALAGLPGVPAGASPELLDHVAGLLQARRARTALEVLHFCDGLPPEVKNLPPFFQVRLLTLHRLNSVVGWENAADYKAALRAAPGILGPESTVDLLLADALRVENDFAGVDECLKRTAEALGGADPYLSFQRADNCLRMKMHDKALALLDEVARESTWAQKAANLRIKVFLDRRDHPAVVEALRAFRKDFGVVLGRRNYFVQMDSQEFLASPEFLAWEKETTTGSGPGQP